MTNEKPNLFLCNCKADKIDYATPLHDELEKLGLKCFYDMVDIAAGNLPEAEINKALGESDVHIVLISDNLMSRVNQDPSGVLVREIHQIPKDGKKFIPVVINSKDKFDKKFPLYRFEPPIPWIEPKELAKKIFDLLDDNTIYAPSVNNEPRLDTCGIRQSLANQFPTHSSGDFEYEIARIMESAQVITLLKDEMFKLGVALEASNIRIFTAPKKCHFHHHKIEYVDEKSGSRNYAIQTKGTDGLIGYLFNHFNKNIAYYPCPDYAPFAEYYKATDEKNTLLEVAFPIDFVSSSSRVGVLLVIWTKKIDKTKKDFYEKTIKERKKKHLDVDQFINFIKEHIDTVRETISTQIVGHLEDIHKNRTQNLAKFNAIVDKYLKESNSDRAYIGYLNDDGLLNYAMGESSDNDVESFLPISATEGICGTVLRENTPVMTPDLSTHSEAIVSDPNYLKLLATPIVRDKVVVGVFDVERKKDKDEYTKNDKLIMERAAAEVSKEFILPDSNYLNQIKLSLTAAFLCSGLSNEQIFKLLKDYAFFIIDRDLTNQKYDGTIRYDEIDIDDPKEEHFEIDWNKTKTSNIFYINYGGRPEKILKINEKYLNYLGPDAVDKIQQCVELAASALKRQKIIDSFQKLSGIISKLGRVCLNPIMIPSYLELAIRETNSILQATHTTLFWVSPKDTSLLIPAISTSSILIKNKDYLKGYLKNTGITGQVFREKLPILINDLRSQKALKQAGITNHWSRSFSETLIIDNDNRLDNARAFLGCPIINRKSQELIGVIRSCLNEKEIKPLFTKTDLTNLLSISTAIAPLLVEFLTNSNDHNPRVKIISNNKESNKPHKYYTRLSPPMLNGYNFSLEEIDDCFENDQILNLYFCKSSSSNKTHDHVSRLDLIKKAIDFGVKSVSFNSNHEIFKDESFMQINRLLKMHSITPIFYARPSTITSEIAELLKQSNSTIIFEIDKIEFKDFNIKLDKNGQNLIDAIDYLLRADFQFINKSNLLSIAISFTIKDPSHISFAKSLWEYCRENAIFPIIQLEKPGNNIPVRSSFENDSFDQEINKIKNEIILIENSYGFDNDKDASNHDCNFYKYSFLIDDNFIARLCPGLNGDNFSRKIHIENFKEILQELRLAYKTEKTACPLSCNTCDHSDCKGCSINRLHI